MQKIDWESAQKKNEAYAYLAKVFKVKKPAVSLAMSFKRNSLKAAQMRYVAVRELGGKYLTDKDVEIKPTKVLDAHGNVKAVIIEPKVTL
ncbi:hypothetical protein [Bacteroides nordii]|uniref:hypothetical protein n=1 Tax=Bacteroides nordii TaxID=291645 RepID=UPI003999CCBD